MAADPVPSPLPTTVALAEHATQLPAGPPLPLEGLPAVPGYAVRGEIARGGMGAVLRAEDTRLGRELAVKVPLDRCLEDPAAVARFVAEAKVQGRLQHPGIVPVHEPGEFAPGQPFFSMKLVGGHTLADLLRDRPAPPHDLPRFVQLFEQVGQAVAYAHAQGVVHRDLKPANVMVGAFGEVQVMDWGLAKRLAAATAAPPDAAEGPPADPPPAAAIATLPAAGTGGSATRAGAVFGTPAYMAPEQARGEPVDARADVFALGAVLCELLTGKPPYPGPTVLDTLGEAADGDLADAHARLDACAADAAVLLGGAATAWFAHAAHDRARSLAAANAQVAAEADRANAQEREARAQARQAAAVAAFRKDDPAATTEQLRAVDLLRAAAAKLDTQYRGDAVTKARLLFTLAETHANLGDHRAAVALRERALAARRAALPEDHPDVLASLHHPAATYQDAGRVADALPLYRDVLARNQARLGADHPDTLVALNNLAAAYQEVGRGAAALALLEQAVPRQRAVLGPDHPQTLVGLNNLANAYTEAGRVADALPLLEALVPLRRAAQGPDHPDTLLALNNLARAYQDAGRGREALALYEAVVPRSQAKLGPDHPHTLAALNNLATAYQDAGRADEAVPLLAAVVGRARAAAGPDHPFTLSCLNNLGRAAQAAGRPAAAVGPLEEAVRRGRARPGGPDPNLVTYEANLSRAYLAAGRPADAEPLLEAAVRRRRAAAPADGLKLAAALAQLGQCRLQAGRYAAAAEALGECLELRARAQPAAWTTASARSLLGAALLGQRRYADAEPLLVEGWAGLRAQEAAVPAQGRANLPAALARLVQLYAATGRPEAAEPYRAELGRRLAAELGRDPAWPLL